MRAYEQTHPWLRFEVDLRSAPARLWILLGEAASKCEHLAGTPLRPDVADRLHLLYLAKGVLATTAIEGNTLSEREVLDHLEGRLRLPPSRQYLAQEIDNIVAASNEIFGGLQTSGDLKLTPGRLLGFNRNVLKNLPLGEGVVPGEFRKHAVGVAGYRAAPAEDCAYLVDRLCQWLEGETFRPAPGLDPVYAILKAALAHLYLAWIHPFGDGNGRTARLAEFHILVTQGVPSAAAHLLSNHYNQTRAEYYRQLDHASRSGGEVVPFLEYAAQGFVDGLREQIGEIRRQQWDLVWEAYVDQEFRGQTSQAQVRRRMVATELSRHGKPASAAQIAALTPKLAAAYARKTRKTATRDLNALAKMGLIRPSANGFEAAKDLVLAFLPARVARPTSGPAGTPAHPPPPARP